MSVAVVMWSILGWNGLEASVIGGLPKENIRDKGRVYPIYNNVLTIILLNLQGAFTSCNTELGPGPIMLRYEGHLVQEFKRQY